MSRHRLCWRRRAITNNAAHGPCRRPELLISNGVSNQLNIANSAVNIAFLTDLIVTVISCIRLQYNCYFFSSTAALLYAL